MLADVERKSAVESFAYQESKGWSQELPAHLDSTGTLVIAFAAPQFRTNPKPFEALQRAFANSTVIGCSTAGEIVGDEVRDASICAAVLQFTKTQLRFASATIETPEDSRAAGRSLAERLRDPGLKAVFVLSTGLSVNGTELVRGLNDAIPADVVVTGGLAGDGSDFRETWVLDQGHAITKAVTAVGFYGDSIRVGHASRGGFDPFGPRRLVTKARGNELFELDGKPALELYRTYLGDRANELPSSALLFPLSVRTQSEPNKSLVRTIIATNDETQSMTFAGDIPDGATAQLMRSNFDRLVTAAGDSSRCARSVHGDNPPSPMLSIAISCVGRRLMLGERTEEELEFAMEGLRPMDRQIGFYSYGELSPFASGPCDLHNQSMTTTTICEH